MFWEVASIESWVNPNLIPAPTKIFAALVDWIYKGNFFMDFVTSLWRGLVGFLIGGSIGIILGLYTGRIETINYLLSPICNVIRAFPPVSLIPVFITFFGIGDFSKIFSISFATIFPVWINTHLGANSIPLEYIRSGKLLTNSKRKYFLRIVFPASLSSIVAGCRISIAVAFVMLYVSELAGSSSGLGYQISDSQLSFRMDKMFAALFVLGFTAAIIDIIYVRSIMFFFPWLKQKLEKK